jgi:hypothetical protein
MIPPMPHGGGYAAMPSVMDNSSIAAMRWNGDAFILQLYKVLGDYDVRVNDDGTYTFKRNTNARPRINDDGLQAIISIVQASVNPFVALSNITNEEANDLIRSCLLDTASEIAANQEAWGIDDSNKTVIMTMLKPLVFNQIKRSVEGHESLNFRTQTFEQNVQQQYTQNQPSGGGFLASFRPSFMQGGRR